MGAACEGGEYHSRVSASRKSKKAPCGAFFIDCPLQARAQNENVTFGCTVTFVFTAGALGLVSRAKMS